VTKSPERVLKAGERVLRKVGHGSRELLDFGDPLRSYNRRLAWVFLARKPAHIAADLRLMPIEGRIEKAQARYFQELLIREPWVRTVAEIGFNAGHSSYLFLNTRPDIEVTSFDLGEHEYTHLAKWLIDEHFPGRHTLVTGDSRQTIPAFTKAQPDRRFDLIFIDGGHLVDVARADIDNCRPLATAHTIVIMDDLNPNGFWGAGPVVAWDQAQHDGLIGDTVLIEDGVPVSSSPTDNEKIGNRWALGHYLNVEIDRTLP
jgi:predicted O-methyltransferase YrrM